MERSDVKQASPGGGGGGGFNMLSGGGGGGGGGGVLGRGYVIIVIHRGIRFFKWNSPM